MCPSGVMRKRRKKRSETEMGKTEDEGNIYLREHESGTCLGNSWFGVVMMMMLMAMIM